jgi:hypothetical protein
MLYGKNYKGFIRLSLFLNNEWVSIYIDDKLPTCKRKLLYSKFLNETSFWVPFIEKAFAKFYFKKSKI